MRQDDGGWLIPAQALPVAAKTDELWRAAPVVAGPALPSSHMAAGMALRAFAVHPVHRDLPAVRAAADLLKSRFFSADRDNDRRARPHWTKLQYPFWWNNLLTAPDSLSLLGYPAGDADVARGLGWFVENQQGDGLWRTGCRQTERTGYRQAKHPEPTSREMARMAWVGLAVCRVFRRLYPTLPVEQA
jgi:hypothetical protein